MQQSGGHWSYWLAVLVAWWWRDGGGAGGELVTVSIVAMGAVGVKRGEGKKCRFL